MKIISLILLSFMWITSIGQWNINYSSANYFSSLYANGKDTIIACSSDYGKIFRTFDGGDTWSFYQTEFTQSWLLDMDFPTPTFGYVCGGTAFGMHGSCIARTSDGGVTWDSITANQFGGEFRHLGFLDKDLGIISGDNNTLLLTIDGCQSFSYLTLPQQAFITEIKIESSNNAFVAATRALAPGTMEYRIYQTSNLGSSWSSVYIDTLENTNGIFHAQINKIQFVTPLIGYAVGGNGLFLKTANGGQTWNRTTIAPYTNLSGLSFVNENLGYINNAGGIYRTTDGGASWTVQQINPIEVIYDVTMVSDTVGFAMGSKSIYKTTNSGVTPLNIEPSSLTKLGIYPNPSNTVINISGEKAGIDRYEILNSIGQIVKSQALSINPIQIGDLPVGVYVIRFIGNQRIETNQFIKN